MNLIIIQCILLILFFLIIYFAIGSIMSRQFRCLQGFELISGFVTIFGIFHLLSVLFTIFHASVNYIYFITYPILLLFLIYMMIYQLKLIKININIFLSSLILLYIGVFFVFDFIIPGDSTFYLSLIRSVTTQSHIYSLEPWTGNTAPIGYMYYFVTYELFIGSLSHLFHIDSTIFTVNVISILNLIIIFTTIYAFLLKIILDKKKVQYAFLIYLFIFIFLNSNLHAVFFSHNAFNMILLPYAGKTIYINGLIVVIFYLINRIVLYRNKFDIILLGILNLVTEGITASALFLQLIVSIIIIVYLIFYKHDKENRFYGFLIIVLLTPLILNYQFILFAPDFYLKSLTTKVGIESLFTLIILIGLFLYFYKKPFINIKHKLLLKIFYISLILIGICSFGSGIYILIKRSNEVHAAIGLLPNIPHLIYLYGYHLVVFYILTFLSIVVIYKKYPQYRFLFLAYIGLMFLLFLNPYNFPLVGTFITSFPTYHRIVYLLPFHFMIVLYLINLKNKKLLFIVLAVIIFPFTTIFQGLRPIYIDNINFYYKIPQDVVDIGLKLDKPYQTIAEEEFISEIPLVTNKYKFVFTIMNIRQVEYQTYTNDELLYLYKMINDKVVFNSHNFVELVKKYDIECIIIHQSNPINQELEIYYHKSLDLSTENINVYFIA